MLVLAAFKLQFLGEWGSQMTEFETELESGNLKIQLVYLFIFYDTKFN